MESAITTLVAVCRVHAVYCGEGSVGYGAWVQNDVPLEERRSVLRTQGGAVRVVRRVCTCELQRNPVCAVWFEIGVV